MQEKDGENGLNNELAVKIFAQLSVDFAEIEKKRKQIQEKLKNIDVEIDASSFDGLKKDLISTTTKFNNLTKETQTVNKYMTELGVITASFGKNGLQVAKLNEEFSKTAAIVEKQTAAVKNAKITYTEKLRVLEALNQETITGNEELVTQIESFRTALDGLGEVNGITQLKNQFTELTNDVRIAKGAVEEKSSVLTDLGKVAAALGVAKVIKGIASAFMYAAGEAAKFEQSIAALQRVSFASQQQMSQWHDGILQMSNTLPFTANAITEVAVEASRLGIADQYVLGFTRTMLDLDAVSTMTAYNAAVQLARLANITGMASSDFDRLGSSISALGNAVAATEGEIVKMSVRLGAAASAASINEASIAGMAAAMSALALPA